MSKPLEMETLKRTGRLFGSRSLGCSKEDSDYDFFWHIDNFPKEWESYLGQAKSYLIYKYFSVCPVGKALLITKVPMENGGVCDIIVFYDTKDYNTMIKATGMIVAMCKINPALFKDKHFRIDVLERLLLCEGFVKSSNPDNAKGEK